MARTYAQMLDYCEQLLQDTNNAIFDTTELDYWITWTCRELAKYKPHYRAEVFNLETRTGTASSTTANALVDTGESQFVSGDTDKVIHNIDDNTWAIVTAFVSSSQLTLSKDIMASGEQYEIYNRYCENEQQIDISDVDDWLDIESVEYPNDRQPRRLRNYKVLDQRRILELKLDFRPDDTKDADADKEARVLFRTYHKLPNLTDTAGAVNNGSGYAAGTTSMAIDALAGAETIPKGAEFIIASVRGTYTTTAAVTLSGGAGTISFYPGLWDAAVDNDVVTITASTIPEDLEEIFAQLVVAKAMLSKGIKYINNIAIGTDVWRRYNEVGKQMMDDVIRQLIRITPQRSSQVYTRH